MNGGTQLNSRRDQRVVQTTKSPNKLCVEPKKKGGMVGIIGGIGGWLGGAEGLSEGFEVGGFSELAFSVGVVSCFFDCLAELAL